MKNGSSEAASEHSSQESELKSTPVTLNRRYSAPQTTTTASGSTRSEIRIQLFEESNTFPEYVRSIKEKECWILFQKMVDKGISITYETILRGMLTPTEVRVVEKKQKEIVERQASLELELAEASAKK